MCLDECPPHDAPVEKIQAAVDRTTIWATRCRDAQVRSDQALFGIVQGGTHQSLRERSVAGLLPLNFPGYAVGGLSVGEEPDLMYKTLDFTVPLLPTDRPRYLMGVGRPIDLLEGVLRGIDLFDCVMAYAERAKCHSFHQSGPAEAEKFGNTGQIRRRSIRNASALSVDSSVARTFGICSSRARCWVRFCSRGTIWPITSDYCETCDKRSGQVVLWSSVQINLPDGIDPFKMPLRHMAEFLVF